jgi:hypothetical protein
MKLPRQWLVRLSPLVEAARGEPLVEPFVETTEEPGHRFVLSTSYGRFVFDRAARRVLEGDTVLAGFDEVQSVDIAAFPGGLGERSWSITLYLGLIRRITMARTYDDGEASVLAARLARILECKVVALSGRS